MIKSLQKRFIVTAMIAITILLALLLGGINLVNVWSENRQNEQLLTALVESEALFKPFGKKDFNFFSPSLTEDSKMAAVYFTAKTDAESEILQIDLSRIASTDEAAATQLVQEALAEKLTQGKSGSFRFKSALSADGRWLVYVFLDTTSANYAVIRVIFLSLCAGLACWLLMLLLVIGLSKKAIKPIAENIERQKQFVTDAGHEIKTPLAIILANTEAMELFNGENKWSRNIRQQSLRLSGLMGNLLTLAKIDENAALLDASDFSLSELLNDSVNMFVTPAELKFIEIRRFIEPDISIKGSREQLARLLSVLLDNAVKYSSDSRPVTVSLKKEGSSAVISVSNYCEALPDCPPEKLFDRFYRADSARTQKSGGFGLGLSAAKAIAEIHKASLEAKYEDENMIVFTFKI